MSEGTNDTPRGRVLKVLDLRIDLGNREVFKQGLKLDLPDLTFALLDALCCSQKSVLSQTELEELLWPGQVVGPDVLKQRIRLLRKALGPSPDGSGYIVNHRGKGYRLAIPAQPAHSQAQGSYLQRFWYFGVAFAAVLVLAIIMLLEVNRPESLLVRVEPMERSDILGPVSKSFVDGLSLELATKIASLPKLRAIGPIDLSNDKDVDVVLRGQLAKGSDRLHLIVSLSDWKTGEIVWGQTYDRPFEEVFEVQRDIALHISFMLFDQVDPEASERLKQGPTKNYQAYALFVQALGSKDRDKALALEYVSAALIHDPSFEAAIKLKRVLEGGS